MTMTAIPIVTIITLFLQQTAKKKCHKFCVFAAACTVSLSSITGFILREIISVHLSILAQISGVHMGVLHAVTTCGPVLLEDKSQGIEGRGRSGTERKWRNTQLIISPRLSRISPQTFFCLPEKEEEARGRIMNRREKNTYHLLGSGPFKDISSFTLLLKICSISRYKTL